MRWMHRVLRPGLAFFLLGATGLSAQHKLTIRFEGMSPHIGQELHIRVVDKANGEEVGRAAVAPVPGAEFDADLMVLLLGHSYRIDFYVDQNGNGQYDAPPADHAWSLDTDDVGGDVELPFTHQANFVDIGWPAGYDFLDFAGVWTGRWDNLTVGSEGAVYAIVEIIPDSQKVRITSTTTGIFGNDESETKVGEGTLTAGGDSAYVNAPAGWAGMAEVAEGSFSGSGSAPDFGGINFDIRGNYGGTQLISTFTMYGPFDANGVIVMRKDLTSVEEFPSAGTNPKTFYLFQNYPNPFNPSTTIRFLIQTAGEAELVVFDRTGRAVKTLVRRFLEPGVHRYEWNARDLPSGIYLCRLRVGGHEETRKLLLQK